MDMNGYCEYFKCFIDDYEELEKLREKYGEDCLQGCQNCEWYEE